MVIIIYAAFVRLRRTEPNVRRGFKIPGGDFMKWVIGIIGIGGAIAASVLSFLPPSQINTGSPVTYIVILIIGFFVLISVPFIIYRCRKPSWRDPNTDFYPFNWEIEGRKPNTVSKWAEGFVPSKTEIQRAMEWADGELGPVTMGTVGIVNEMNVKPQTEIDHLGNLTDDDKPKAEEMIDDTHLASVGTKAPGSPTKISTQPLPDDASLPDEVPREEPAEDPDEN